MSFIMSLIEIIDNKYIFCLNHKLFLITYFLVIKIVYNAVSVGNMR